MKKLSVSLCIYVHEHYTQELAQGLVQNGTLESLDLSYNKSCPAGFRHLFDALNPNHRRDRDLLRPRVPLTALPPADQDRKDGGQIDRDVDAGSSVESQNDGRRVLAGGGKTGRDRTIVDLVGAGARNAFLKKLVLDECELSYRHPDTMLALFDMLANNRTLEAVDLSNNPLGDSCGAAAGVDTDAVAGADVAGADVAGADAGADADNDNDKDTADDDDNDADAGDNATVHHDVGDDHGVEYFDKNSHENSHEHDDKNGDDNTNTSGSRVDCAAAPAVIKLTSALGYREKADEEPASKRTKHITPASAHRVHTANTTPAPAFPRAPCLAAMALSAVLGRNLVLKELLLSDTQLGEECVVELCAGLLRNETLACLSLSGCSLGGRGTAAMAEVLMKGHCSMRQWDYESVLTAPSTASSTASSTALSTSSSTSSSSISLLSLFTSSTSSASLTSSSLISSAASSASLTSAAAAVSGVWRPVCSLTELNLSNADIASHSHMITNALFVNQTLAALNLAHNRCVHSLMVEGGQRCRGLSFARGAVCL